MSYSEDPVYQDPDQANSNITWDPVVPVQVPVAPEIEYEYNPVFARKLFNKFGSSVLLVDRLDYYGNAIPLGAFCNAIAFIIYGFYRCKVYTVNETFLWSVILIFGSLGQITAGCLEYIKARHFPALIYLCFGFYCLSHYVFYVYPKHMVLTQNDSMTYMFYNSSVCAFYSAWVVISFAVLIGSAKSNVLYLCQCLTAFAFFLLRAVGEGANSLGTKRNAAGILQAISGFFSLLVGISQILNRDTFYSPCIPTGPLSPINQIDFTSRR